MKYLLIICIAISAAACTVTREHVEMWERRSEQAQQYAEQAEAIAVQAERLAERLGSEEAQRLAAESRAVAAAAAAAAADVRANPPEEGQPWWVALIGIVSAAAGAWGGYRSGLYHPIPAIKAKR